MLFAFLLGIVSAIAAAAAVAIAAAAIRRRRPADADAEPVFGAMLFAAFIALIVGWMVGAWVSTLVVVGPLGLAWLGIAIVVGVVAVALGERAWRGGGRHGR